jgi:hypothetical protein
MRDEAHHAGRQALIAINLANSVAQLITPVSINLFVVPATCTTNYALPALTMVLSGVVYAPGTG